MRGVEARLCGRRGTGRGKDRGGGRNSSVGDGAMELGIVMHGGLAQACDPGTTLIARNIERPGNEDEFALNSPKSRSRLGDLFSNEEGDKFTESASRGR